MLKDTCVITFSGTSIHRDYQRQFHRLYNDLFGDYIEYTHNDIIDTKFYNDNMQLFKYKKYFGYFLWKPYIIMDALSKTKANRVLYCDSNLRFTNLGAFEKSYDSLMEKQGCFFVRHENHINKQWTKRDTFILTSSDEERYHNAHQVWTSLMGFEKLEHINFLLSEYMSMCKIPESVTDAPSELAPEYPEFIEHRWEQSVMSILVEKFQMTGFPDTQLMSWVTKHYSQELMQMKQEVNSDPLATR